MPPLYRWFVRRSAPTRSSKRLWWFGSPIGHDPAVTLKQVASALVGIGAVVAVFLLVTSLLRDPTDEASETVRRPMRGEVRPDYLADGTPVWVVGHEDGTVSVLSGFDTHRPFNLGKILWWCPTAVAFDNPNHGAKYDEYGLRLGGPAPTGLPSYETRLAGSRVIVGALGEPPGMEVKHTGPSEGDRDWCIFPDDAVVYHSFDGWRSWESPTAAVQAAPDGWILLAGPLWVRDGEVVLCAAAGCEDAVAATNVETPDDPNMQFGPLGGERFIARVRDGALTDVTRVMPSTTR